jgi:hypothetical protein
MFTNGNVYIWTLSNKAKAVISLNELFIPCMFDLDMYPKQKQQLLLIRQNSKGYRRIQKFNPMYENPTYFQLASRALIYDFIIADEVTCIYA